MAGSCCRENGCCGGSTPGSCCYAAPTFKGCLFKLFTLTAIVVSLASMSCLALQASHLPAAVEGWVDFNDTHRMTWAAMLTCGLLGDVTLFLVSILAFSCCTNTAGCCGQIGAAVANAVATTFLAGALVACELNKEHDYHGPTGPRGDGYEDGQGGHGAPPHFLFSKWFWRITIIAPLVIGLLATIVSIMHAKDIKRTSATTYKSFECQNVLEGEKCPAYGSVGTVDGVGSVNGEMIA